jgi:hypothetical protein
MQMQRPSHQTHERSDENIKHGEKCDSCCLKARDWHNTGQLQLNAVQAQVQSCQPKFWQQQSQICGLDHSAACAGTHKPHLVIIPGAAAAIPRRQLPVSRGRGHARSAGVALAHVQGHNTASCGRRATRRLSGKRMPSPSRCVAHLLCTAQGWCR